MDVGHPLHGEAVRARLTPTRLDALRAQLADAVEARGARRGGDLLRLATWRLESGATADGALFARAAFQALAVPDPCWPSAWPGSRCRRARASAPSWRSDGRSPPRGAAPRPTRCSPDWRREARDDAERAEVAVARARNLFWAVDRADDADAVLQAAERLVHDDALRHELTAQRVRLTAANGRPETALAAARPLLEDGGIDELARMTAAMGAVEALFTSGRTGEAIALAERWLPVARRRRHELPPAEPVLLGMRAMAMRLAGRLVEATTTSERTYDELLARRTAVAVAVEANSLGLIWLARGRVRTALRFCRESAALLRDGDGVGMLAFALAGIAQAAAEAGEPATARAAIAEMERTPLGHKGFAGELALAQAWSAAASGDLARGRAFASDAAALARSRGQHAYTVRALHALCRLGDPAAAAAELAALAGRVDGPHAATAAAHAAALVAGDGAALLAVAERFAGQDALLVAVEAADAAAAAHRDAGRQASARAAAARAGLWLTHCEGARPPTLLATPRRRRPDAARARDRPARRRRVEQPRDRRAARRLGAHGRQPPAERLPQARRHAPPGPPARAHRGAGVAAPQVRGRVQPRKAPRSAAIPGSASSARLARVRAIVARSCSRWSSQSGQLATCASKRARSAGGRAFSR